MSERCDYSVTEIEVVALLGSSYRRDSSAGGLSRPMAVRLTLQVILMENLDPSSSSESDVRFTNKPITGVLDKIDKFFFNHTFT